MAILFLASTGLAQTPVPAPTPIIPTQIDGNTLSGFLENVVTNFVNFKTAFINTVEGTLGGYFGVLAYILAWIIAVFYFVQQFIRGEWDAAEIGRYSGRLVLCLLLLISCGDVDGDGKRGDIVRGFGYIGYHLAFGQTPDEPTGNFISRTVDEQSEKFNTNYQAFVENKLMVKINDRDMPVRYPGMQGVQTVAAVYIGQASPEQKKETLTQEFWIGLLFQILNLCRSIIEIIDFFLLALFSFGILVMSIVSPFMMCVFVNRDLAKRFTYPFIWTVITVCVVFPVLSQGARYFAYLSGNLALGTSGNPNYSFDPTTFTIVANGDPTPMILVAVLCMLISILFLAMSVVLSYALVQGRLVEAMSGLIANAFAGISSVGVGALVSGYSTRLSAEGEKKMIEAAEDSTMTRAGYNLEAQKLSAENAKNVNDTMAQGNYASSMLNAEGQRDSSQISAMGSLLGGLYSTEATRVGTVNGAVTNFRHALAGMSTEEKQAYANNLADMLSKNNDAGSKKMADDLRLHPEKLDLLAENYENLLNGIPIIGSAAKTIGVNKDSINAWTRTGDPNSSFDQAFKTTGQWMLGNPETGQMGVSLLNKATGTQPINIAGSNAQEIYGNSQTPVFQRPDGTMINALSGETIPQAPNASLPTSGRIFNPGSPSVQQSPDSFLSSLSSKERNTLDANFKALQRTNRQDPDFLPTIQRFSASHNLNPNDVLNLLALESGFQKTANNGLGYVGLGQVGQKERRSIGWSGDDATDIARLSRMSPSDQLDSLVFPFMEKKLGRKLDGADLSTMYAAWGSGHATGDPNAVHMVNGGYRNKAYDNNPAWDVNKDGKVQEWEFGVSPLKKLGAGILFDANNMSGQFRTPKARSSNIGAVTAAGTKYGNTSTQVSSASSLNTPAPGFYNQGEAISKINNAGSTPNQKFLAKKLANESEYQNAIANNRVNYDNRNEITRQAFGEKRINEQNYTTEQIQNANQVSAIQQKGLYTSYDHQTQASNTLYGYQSKAAAVSRDTSLSTGQMNYNTSMKTAALQYQGERDAAQITKDAALEGLYKRNMANLVQSVGSSISHQISELFERASRGM